MIQRYSPGNYAEMNEDDRHGEYVKYNDMLEYMRNGLDYQDWFKAVFPDSLLVIKYGHPGNGDFATLIATQNCVISQVSGTQEQWESKDGRANMVQWLCKALMTGLLNNAMEG
jgi:hypothetical protein